VQTTKPKVHSLEVCKFWKKAHANLIQRSWENCIAKMSFLHNFVEQWQSKFDIGLQSGHFKRRECWKNKLGGCTLMKFHAHTQSRKGLYLHRTPARCAPTSRKLSALLFILFLVSSLKQNKLLGHFQWPKWYSININLMSCLRLPRTLQKIFSLDVFKIKGN
jgi:hypothetical protein